LAGAFVLALCQAAVAQTTTITADASQSGPTMASNQLGINLMEVVPEDGDPTYLPLLSSAGVHLIRWPGGALSDFYHWQTNTYSACSTYLAFSGNAFDTWMQTIAQPLGAEVTITVNYGTNAACTGRGDPAEAAAWVNYANNTRHYGIKYWTVGNEQYFPLLGLSPGASNPDPIDPMAYATAVANQFYPLMKAQDPTVQVGIDMAFGNATYNSSADAWDQTVLANAKYDFVEMHYYPEFNNQDNDTTILTKWADQIATNFATARSLLAASGHANAPIFLGEFDRDSGGSGVFYLGHESVSIVDALFNAIVIGEVVKAGVGRAAAWNGIDNCSPDAAPVSTAYGWQKFGSFGLFAAGGSGFSISCPDNGVAKGTAFPKARAYQILKQYVVAGEHAIGVTSSNPAVRAYAATNHGGYAFLLVNTDPANAQAASVMINNAAGSSFSATTLTYGKAQYDQSQNGVWAGPVSGSLGTVGTSFGVSLQPWSITLVQVAPTNILSAVLPNARTTTVGGTVTAFATIVNAGPATATGCSIALPNGVAATFLYRTTDPATNLPTGTPNTPVDIPAGQAQTFYFAVTPSAAFLQDIAIVFQCANTAAAPSVPGLNTFLLAASSSPIPDMLSIADTLTHEGIVHIPGTTGQGVMATAAINIGAAGTVTFVPTPTPGGQPARSLAANLTICQTDPTTGACVNPATPGPLATVVVAKNQTVTFSVFVQGQGAAIPLDPASTRVFILAVQGTSTVGEAGAAVCTGSVSPGAKNCN
jgi:hypothetical protein